MGGARKRRARRNSIRYARRIGGFFVIIKNMDIYKEKFGASEKDIREALDYGEIARTSARLSEIFKEMSLLANKREEGELSEEENQKWEELVGESEKLRALRGLMETRLG